MKHLEDLKDVGIGCLLMMCGVVLIVQFVQWLISLIL